MSWLPPGAAISANQQRAAASQQRDQAIEKQIVAEAGQHSASDPSLAARLLLTAYRRDQQSQDLAWRLISTENQPLSTSENLDSQVNSVAFSPDGKTLAAGDVGEVTLWDVGSAAGPRQLGRPITVDDSDTVNSVAFSPDGKILAVGDGSGIGAGELTLWDVSSPAGPRQLGRPIIVDDSDSVESVAFSPDGKTLAGGDDGGEVTLWYVGSAAGPRQLGRPISAGDSDSVNSVAFSPDGKTLAAGEGAGGEVMLWDVAAPARPRQLGRPVNVGGSDDVDSVAFSPDGKTLADGVKGDDGGEVMLWDVKPLRPGPASSAGPSTSATATARTRWRSARAATSWPSATTAARSRCGT